MKALLCRGFRLAIFFALIGLAPSASAHDLRLELDELERGVDRILRTIEHYRRSPVIPPEPKTIDDHRRLLGNAEIELAIGNRAKALQILIGRLVDPVFSKMPEYSDALLLTSQILEEQDEGFGAMSYARQALEHGGVSNQMAEAGARWFRLARRLQRYENRAEMLDLWRAKNGAKAASAEARSAAAYEAAFAMRADGQLGEAQKLLASVASDSSHGSRAAYLAGVIYLENGDLKNAERWFSAVMGWPIAGSSPGESQHQIELEVRELAALSGARLRFERGDWEGAEIAYATIGDGSIHQADACFERIYLAMEQGRHRRARKYLQCVLDLGAGGERHIDARLLRASLLSHVAQYEPAIEFYKHTHADMLRDLGIVSEAFASLSDPAEFLFSGLERNAVTRGRSATPGPPVLFADVWNPEVDRAYRVDRNLRDAISELDAIFRETEWLTERLKSPDVFPAMGTRRDHLRRLLRDIQHLQGHTSDVMLSVSPTHASVGDPEALGHLADAARSRELLTMLDSAAGRVEGEIVALDRDEQARKDEAERTLSSIQVEVRGLGQEAESLRNEAKSTVDLVAKAALDSLLDRLRNASMRAEVGVLDTFWLKKEHSAKQIRQLALEREEVVKTFQEAIEELYAGD